MCLLDGIPARDFVKSFGIYSGDTVYHVSEKHTNGES
jgi:hypothetical protein